MSKGIIAANKELKKKFFQCFLVGAAALLFTTFSKLPIWSIMIIGTAPVGWYIFYGQKLSSKHRDEVGFGDSVYYLGFSLTLISLFFAVVNERLVTDEGTQKTLQYFGFALLSTIVGIVYRTLENQFIYEDNSLPPGEAERISAEIDDFAKSMDDLRSGLTNLTNSVNNEIPNAFSNSVSQVKTGINNLSETLNDEMPKINQEISIAYKDLANVIKDLAIATSDSKNLFNNSMNDVSRPLNEAIQKISNDLNNQDVTIDKSIFYELEQNIKNINEEFANSVKNLSAHLNDQKIDASLFNKLSRNMSTLNSKFEDMNTKFESLTSSYASALQQMNENNLKALEEAKKLNEELDKVKNSSNSGGFGRGFFGR